MKKKLIYYTLGFNEQYIKLLELSLMSLYTFDIDDVEVLIITNEKIKDIIDQNLNTNLTLKYHIVKSDSLLESSMNKLKIYEFEEIKNFEKIIFCDSDTIWLKSPQIIFDLIEEDVYYITNENGLMSEDYWGGNLYNSDEKNFIIQNKIKGINAGFFCFNNTLVNEIKEVEILICNNSDKLGVCLEQPYLNVFLFRKNKYTNILNDYVTHDGYNTNSKDFVLYHFAGGPGNFNIKYTKMKNFYENNFNKR